MLTIIFVVVAVVGFILYDTRGYYVGMEYKRPIENVSLDHLKAYMKKGKKFIWCFDAQRGAECFAVSMFAATIATVLICIQSGMICYIHINLPAAMNRAIANKGVYEKQADEFSEIVRAELLKYPEYELSVIRGIDVDILLQYPDLKTNTVLIEGYTSMLKYRQLVYDVDLQINDLNARKEIYGKYIKWL